ncbi:MAG: hypothetical protein PWP67_1491 [Clostridium butyricum]|nr:hypothetical protein [Clostridium butyricum]
MKRKLYNGLNYYENESEWRKKENPRNTKGQIIFSILIFIAIILYNIIPKLQHYIEMKPKVSTQEYAIHQTLVDSLKDYYGYYEVGSFNTSIKGNALITTYSINVGDKSFTDNISIDYSKEINLDSFTDKNKSTLKEIISYASKLKEEDTLNNLEQTLVSYSIEFIKQDLIYPNNASFGGANMEKREDGTYIVKGNVKAMNAFGADIKYKYYVRFEVAEDFSNFSVVDYNVF